MGAIEEAGLGGGEGFCPGDGGGDRDGAKADGVSVAGEDIVRDGVIEAGEGIVRGGGGAIDAGGSAVSEMGTDGLDGDEDEGMVGDDGDEDDGGGGEDDDECCGGGGEAGLWPKRQFLPNRQFGWLVHGRGCLFGQKLSLHGAFSLQFSDGWRKRQFFFLKHSPRSQNRHFLLFPDKFFIETIFLFTL
jgi:hypothetical protein